MAETRLKKGNKDCTSDVVSLFEDLKKQIFKTQEETMKKLLDIEESQSFISRQYDDIIKKLDKMTELEVKFKKCEADNENKNKVISELSARLSRMEQYSRKNMIEISNIAFTKEENPVQLAIKVASKFGVPLQTNDIQAAHRLGRPIEGKTPNMIVELASRPKRDQWLTQRKRTVLNSEVTGKDKGKIFIYESMSPYFKELNFKVRNIIKESNKKYFVWYKDYSILVRRDLPNFKPIKIKCSSDLPLLERIIQETQQ